MEALKIEKTVVAEKNAVVIQLHGPLGPYTVSQFSDLLQDLFDSGSYRMVLDMNDVEYISSAGVGALISAQTTAQKNKGDVVLIHPKPKVLELFGLLDYFHFATDTKAALELL